MYDCDHTKLRLNPIKSSKMSDFVIFAKVDGRYRHLYPFFDLHIALFMAEVMVTTQFRTLEWLERELIFLKIQMQRAMVNYLNSLQTTGHFQNIPTELLDQYKRMDHVAFLKVKEVVELNGRSWLDAIMTVRRKVLFNIDPPPCRPAPTTQFLPGVTWQNFKLNGKI